MAIATGIGKELRVKVESAWGELPGTGSAQLMRRVQSTLNLVKNTFQSNEIRTDYQIADFRHGTRRVEGNISGELSGGTYQTFIEAALRNDAVSISNITGVTLTVVDSGPYTITRSSGSWIADGLRVGMIPRATAGLNAASLNRNFAVVALTATVITYLPMDGGAPFVAEAAVASCTVTVPGQVLRVPLTGHVDRSFAIEEYHADLTLSRLFTGCKVSTMSIAFPASGMVTCEFGFMGKDMIVDPAAEYFVTPSAATTSGILAAVNGVLLVNGAAVGLVNAASLSVAGGHTAGEVIGSNTTPDIFEGRVNVTGQMTVYFQDEAFIEGFLDEDELSVLFFATETNAGNSHFTAVYLPRIKLGGAALDDGEKGLLQTVPFQALLAPDVTGDENTTIRVQDSRYA